MYRITSICSVMMAVLVMIIFSFNRVKATDTVEPDSNINSPLGSNLHPLADWSSEYPFVDAFKMSRQWVPLKTKEGWIPTTELEALKTRLDENGWVKSLPKNSDSESYRYVGTIMFTGLNGNYPKGEYTVLYDGQGVIEYGNDATKNIALSTPGRDIFTVATSAIGTGISLKIVETDPNGTGDYIRNIRVFMPEYSEQDLNTSPFNRNFLNSINSYKVLRFMDWMRINWTANQTSRAVNDEAATMMLPPLNIEGYNPYVRHTNISEPVNWWNRPLLSDAQYTTDQGAPLELMIRLANEMGADPWFNIPHTADDEYVTQFATTVLENLGSQNIYIEYSNEVWNDGFGQGKWVEAKGVSAWPNSSESNYTKRLNWYGKRSAEICTIWKAVFEQQESRVICVIATQAMSSWGGKQMLDCPLRGEGRECYKDIDAVAIAPYFGQHIGSTHYKDVVESWANSPTGLDDLFKELESGTVLPVINQTTKANLPDIYQKMAEYIDLASKRNLFTVAYEGGQHLAGVGSVASNPKITDLFARANRDSRMGALYFDYLNKWNQLGGHQFVHYINQGTYGQWGNWGAQEYYNSADSAKKIALRRYIGLNSCLWNECFPNIGLMGGDRPSVPTAVQMSRQHNSGQNHTYLWLLFSAIVISTSIVLRRKIGKPQ